MEIEASSVPHWFAELLRHAGGSKHLSAKTQALRDHYERLSAKVFNGQTYGKDKVPLHATPYCFRHAVTTQLRESGWSAKEIAAFLGQQSDDTPKHYGLPKGGKRKTQPQATAVVRSSVQASQPVKDKKSNWANAEFGSKPQTHPPLSPRRQ